MNEVIEKTLLETPLIGKGYTLGTSLVTHVSHKLSNLLLLEIERLIKANSELNLASWRALRGLSMVERSSQKELVKFANLDQGQMSRALTDLEKKGLVASERSEVDRRSWCFSITDQGQSYHQKLSPIVNNFHQTLTETLTQAELESFIHISAKIAASVANQ